MRQATVAIIMTARNAQRCVGDAIRSVQSQTLADWRLIVVDDGSTDATRAVVASFADPRIELVATPGCGRPRALNRALAHAAGARWFANLDADDVMHPQKLELQTEFLRHHPEFALVATNVQLFFDDELPTWTMVVGTDLPYTEIGTSIVYRNPIGHSSVMANLARVDALGGYDAGRRSQIDYELWLRMRAAGCRMALLDACLGGKRIHSGQSFENKHRMRYLTSRLQLQLTAVRRSSLPFYYSAYVLAGFAFGLLPQRLRMEVRSNRPTARPARATST
jgi:glycosyltransferase involved in cell wall biosynthesis